MIERYHIYCHIPFCKKRCPYCYFTAKFSEEEMINLDAMDEYVKAMKADIEKADFPDAVVTSIVCGGGTPSLLNERQLDTIIDAIRSKLPPDRFNGMEFMAYEVSPDTASEATLITFRNKGFNRVSIGAQSFVDEELKLLGRPYTREMIVKAAELVRKVNYDMLNIDLLIGIPGQTHDSVIQSIKDTVTIKPEHISVSLFYSSYPGGKEFVQKCEKRGKLIPYLSDKIQIYEDVCRILMDNGYVRVDNTVFSLPDYVFPYEKDAISETEPVLAFGPGSAGYWDNNRVRFTPPYINKYIEAPASVEEEITVDNYAFTIVWGHLNAYGKIEENVLEEKLGFNFEEVMRLEKDVNILLSVLIQENLVFRQDSAYILRPETLNRAIVLMHYIRDGWGYKLITAPEQTLNLN
ncbi:radical SAM protein [Paenibacillus sp. M1]|uniref:Heme chaperone HemW n=1 Tax=Paenibacillus haidiansis TaxID=1574488 RepID=A0ABU7VS86_9BACL